MLNNVNYFLRQRSSGNTKLHVEYDVEERLKLNFFFQLSTSTDYIFISIISQSDPFSQTRALFVTAEIIFLFNDKF